MSSATLESVLAATWPQARATEALRALARAAGIPARGRTPVELESAEGVETLGARLQASAEECELELEAVEAPYARVEELLARAAPALLKVVDASGEARLIALLRGGRRPCVLAPDGARHRCERALLFELLCGPHERGLDPLVTRVLDEAGLEGARRTRARRALIGEHLAAVPIGGAWIVRLPPGRSFLESARRAGLARLSLAVVSCGFAASFVGLLSWIPFGRSVGTRRLGLIWSARASISRLNFSASVVEGS